MPEAKDPTRKRIEDAYRELLASLERTPLLNGVRQDARDMVHEIFMAFVEGRVDLAQIENLQAYLKTSLRHAWGRALRKRALERPRELRIDQPGGDGSQIHIATEDRLDDEG